MLGSRDVGFPKTSGPTLKEQLARKTLRNVRLQGHIYVELRENKKGFIFFCILCQSSCYNDSVLFDHLRGNPHNLRHAAAKATLLKQNPWPFNDGVLFFCDSTEQDMQLSSSDGNGLGLLNASVDIENDLSIVPYDDNGPRCSYDGYVCDKNCESQVFCTDAHISHFDRNLYDCGEDYNLVIPGVLCEDELSDLQVKFIGTGQIAARYREKDGVSNEINRIWCEWLGAKDLYRRGGVVIPTHEFAVVTFAYNYNLGRKTWSDDVRHLLSYSPILETEDADDGMKRRRKSFSDPEDTNEPLSNPYDSSGEESQSSNISNSRLLLKGYDDQLLHSRLLSSKRLRKELRRHQRLSAERMCDICQQEMLPGKDVGALVNMNTGRLVCSSRNVNGAFHLFHISCLVHWILLCELETCARLFAVPRVIRGSRRKTDAKFNETGKENEMKTLGNQIYSVFCPECQGTGMDIDGDNLEKPTVSLSEIFKFKIKVTGARRAWMKNPELLENCSTGFYFPSQYGEPYQENVALLKLLHFYRAV